MIQTSEPDRETTGGTNQSTVLITVVYYYVQSWRYSDTPFNWNGMTLACESRPLCHVFHPISMDRVWCVYIIKVMLVLSQKICRRVL